MTDETDTTSAVARVLREHFDPTGAERQDPYAAAVYEEAAAALAEAGLLREFPGREGGTEVGETPRNPDGDGWDRVLRLASELNIAAHEASQTAQQAQIAAQEPAGGEGVGTSGTLSGRLRAAADYQDRPGAYDELRAMADEVHRLEVHARVVEQSLRTARGEVRP